MTPTNDPARWRRFAEQTGPNTKPNRIWDADQSSRLLALIANGASVVRAAAALRRSQTSVRIQARKLGQPFPTMLEARRRRSAREAEAMKGSRPWTI